MTLRHWGHRLLSCAVSALTRAGKPPVVVLALLMGLAVSPVIMPASRIIAGMRSASPASDFALLELSTGEALRGTQLLGPYSRFGWRHPGPAYFYVQAPLYAASGASSASLPVAVLLFNWAALLCVVVCLRRWVDQAAVPIFALALFLVYGLYLGSGFLYNIWNPAVTILPLGLFLIVCAGLACGSAMALPIVVVLGSFLIQTHVGYLPCVAAGAVTSGALWLRRSRRSGDVATSQRLPVMLAIATLAALWTLPLVEQLTRDPGNMSLILRFFSGDSDGHTLGEALAIVTREIAWPWSYVLFGSLPWYAPYPPLEGWRHAVSGAFALGQIGLLAFWSVRLRARSFLGALACVCLVCTMVAVLATTRVSGEIRPYVTAWISMVGLLGSLAAIGPLLAYRSLALPIGRDQGALILAIGLAIPVALVGRPLVVDSQFQPARSLSEAVKAELLESGVHRPHVEIETGSPELVYGASAVLLQVHKAGVQFSVDRVWLNFFGERWQASGREDGRLQFRAGRPPGAPPALACVPNGASELCVWLVRSANLRTRPPLQIKDLHDAGTHQFRRCGFAKRGALATRDGKGVETVSKHWPTCLLNSDPLLLATMVLKHTPRIDDKLRAWIAGRDVRQKHQKPVIRKVGQMFGHHRLVAADTRIQQTTQVTDDQIRVFPDHLFLSMPPGARVLLADGHG